MAPGGTLRTPPLAILNVLPCLGTQQTLWSLYCIKIFTQLSYYETTHGQYAYVCLELLGAAYEPFGEQSAHTAGSTSDPLALGSHKTCLLNPPPMSIFRIEDHLNVYLRMAWLSAMIRCISCRLAAALREPPDGICCGS